GRAAQNHEARVGGRYGNGVDAPARVAPVGHIGREGRRRTDGLPAARGFNVNERLRAHTAQRVEGAAAGVGGDGLERVSALSGEPVVAPFGIFKLFGRGFSRWLEGRRRKGVARLD